MEVKTIVIIAILVLCLIFGGGNVFKDKGGESGKSSRRNSSNNASGDKS